MFRGFREFVFSKKVKKALHNIESQKVLLKEPVMPNEGPWLVMDPVGGSSCVPRVRLIKDSETYKRENIIHLS